MIQCPIPNKMITQYKPKVVFGLTMRNLICGALGIVAIFGIGFFGVCKNMAIDNRAIVSAIFGIPFFVVGWGSLYGQPIERILPCIIWDNFFAPAVRKKEIHHKEMEEYEKTLKFMMPKETSDDSLGKKKKSSKQSAPKKIKVKKSQTYKAIK